MAECEGGTSRANSEISASTDSLDFSCIHWGYLNCTHVIDSGKRGKQAHSWQTCWVDLCGSTLRLYRDLSISPDSAIYAPPSSVIGPTEDCQKKEAFIVLTQGAVVDIIDYEEEMFKPRKKGRQEIIRNHVFKLSFAIKGQRGGLAYLFQAPSKSSLYRWISKVEEGIAHADKPLTESATESSSLTSALKLLKGYPMYKKLKQAKVVAMEQRRYQVPSEEIRYPENRDDVDSGMEGDAEESFLAAKKPPPNPRLESLMQILKQKEEQLQQLQQQERDFTGGEPDNPRLTKVRQFQATTKAAYLLVPGFPDTLLPAGTALSVFGQLPNGRWRCCVQRPGTSAQPPDTASPASSSTSLGRAQNNSSEVLIGSVPSSLLAELDELPPRPAVEVPQFDLTSDGTPTVSPNSTPRRHSPASSPPGSPYSPHKGGVRRPTGESNLSPSNWKTPSSEVVGHIAFPSPPSSAVSSRSSSAASLDELEDREEWERNSALSADPEGEGDDVPVTYIGSEAEDHVIVAERSLESSDVVRRRPKKTPLLTPPAAEVRGNYAFHVTRKLRQRGISLLVGSSSSEDEDDSDSSSLGSGGLSQISTKKLDREFQNFKSESLGHQPGVRPYSTAFMPRQKLTVSLPPQTGYQPRSATTAELLRDYSCGPPGGNHRKAMNRSSTCSTLTQWSVPLAAPPLNQRRTLRLTKNHQGGFGFSLQTYGIVQREGHVEYTTFVLEVQEDGPAYVAGLRPGDVIIEISGQAVEDADHKTLVRLIQQAHSSFRMVVVFVDAISKMKLNTRLKLLKSKLGEKEREFDELSKREQELLQGCGGGGAALELLAADLSQRRGRRANSYLYTTELTSRFPRDGLQVEEQVRQYRQEGPDRARRISLPDVSQLGQRDDHAGTTSTTGNHMLRSFSSSENVFGKASIKLQKSIKKKRPSSKTFTSYVDLAAQTGSMGSLSAHTGSMDGFPAQTGSMGSLPAQTRSMGSLPAQTGSMGSLPAQTRSMGSLPAQTGSMGSLPAQTGSIGSLPAQTGSMGSLATQTGSMGSLAAPTGSASGLNLNSSSSLSSGRSERGGSLCPALAGIGFQAAGGAQELPQGPDRREVTAGEVASGKGAQPAQGASSGGGDGSGACRVPSGGERPQPVGIRKGGAMKSGVESWGTNSPDQGRTAGAGGELGSGAECTQESSNGVNTGADREAGATQTPEETAASDATVEVRAESASSAGVRPGEDAMNCVHPEPNTAGHSDRDSSARPQRADVASRDQAGARDTSRQGNNVAQMRNKFEKAPSGVGRGKVAKVLEKRTWPPPPQRGGAGEK